MPSSLQAFCPCKEVFFLFFIWTFVLWEGVMEISLVCFNWFVHLLLFDLEDFWVSRLVYKSPIDVTYFSFPTSILKRCWNFKIAILTKSNFFYQKVLISLIMKIVTLIYFLMDLLQNWRNYWLLNQFILHFFLTKSTFAFVSFY